MMERDVLHLLLARRENYAISYVSHLRGRIYTLTMNEENYNAVVLSSSFQFYELRYHVAKLVPNLIVCYEHTTTLPVACLSLRAGNFAKPYELPEGIYDVGHQRMSKIGSQVLLGAYICGVRSAHLIIDALPVTTRKRYLSKAKSLGKRRRGKPVNASA